jgi:hypothetical protein
MNRGFANIAIMVLLVVVVVSTGWWYLNKSNPASDSPEYTILQENVAQQQKTITITSPTDGTKIDSYASFTVQWSVLPAFVDRTVEVYVTGAPQHAFTCLPGQNTEKSGSYECAEKLVAEVPASAGAYTLNINPGCAFEMPVHIRIATKDGTGSDSVGPIILQGGACGPG